MGGAFFVYYTNSQSKFYLCWQRSPAGNSGECLGMPGTLQSRTIPIFPAVGDLFFNRFLKGRAIVEIP